MDDAICDSFLGLEKDDIELMGSFEERLTTKPTTEQLLKVSYLRLPSVICLWQRMKTCLVLTDYGHIFLTWLQQLELLWGSQKL